MLMRPALRTGHTEVASAASACWLVAGCCLLMGQNKQHGTAKAGVAGSDSAQACRTTPTLARLDLHLPFKTRDDIMLLISPAVACHLQLQCTLSGQMAWTFSLLT